MENKKVKKEKNSNKKKPLYRVVRILKRNFRYELSMIDYLMTGLII